MSRFWLLLLVMVVGAGMLAACDKTEDPTDPGGGGEEPGIPDAIALAREIDPILADGVDAAEIFVIVVDAGGGALPGIGVAFSTSAGSIVSLATTDDQGIARSLLTAAASVSDLTATVTAAAGGSGAPLPGDAFLLLTSRPVSAELALAAMARVRARPADGVAATAADVSSQIPVRMLGVTLTVSASPTVLPADGLSASRVRAGLVETTTRIPIAGGEIRFGTSIGSITGRVPTDETGTAVASLTSTAGGTTSQVTAYYGDLLTAGTSVTFEAPSAQSSSLVLTAEDVSISANGLASATITAVVTDAFGNPPPEGTEVEFQTTLGVLDNVLPTDGDGVASARLRAAPLRTGLARVTAVWEELQSTVDVRFVSGPAGQIVVKDVANPSLGVRGAGSEETAFITWEVRDRDGIPVDADHPVTVTFAVVPKSGEIDATVSPAAAVTDADGLVRAAVQSGVISGTIEIEAKSGSLAATPIRIAVHGGLPDPAHFSVSTERLNIAGLVFDGIQNGITARVGDDHGNPVPLNTRVWFEAEFGLVQGSAGTDDHGEATVWEITAAPRPAIPGGDGLVEIVAQTIADTGAWITTSVHVMWSGPTILQITSPASGFEVQNGGSIAITFVVRDANQNPLTGGTGISVEATGGTVGGTSDFTLPDTQSSAYTTFSAVLSDDDPDQDRAEAVTVTVRVTSENGNREASITGTIH